MAKEINQKAVEALAKIVKSNPGNSEKFYSDKSGIPMGQILRHLVLAELIADPSLKIPATGVSIEKARNAGVRWPRIAARAGITESRAKELFEEKTGTAARESYTGRGRNFAGTAPAKGAGTSGRRGAAGNKKPAGTSGRRGAAAQKTGVNPVARRGAKPGPKPAGRRGTRSSAKASDPK